ncbi:MAG: glycosyltransferase [Anaerolineales bacterium]|nr:glycosyltransferase [Anaerolineales bacterium]
MRILFLANYYPPHGLGGQERSCQEVFEGLQARGHECLVLTSMHGVDNVPTDEPGVRRWLYLEMDMVPLRHGWIFFTQRKQREAQNLARLERLINEFKPDVVYVWGMWNLPRTLPALAERLLPGRVAYRFAEYWPTLPSQHEFFWRAPAKNWRTYVPKRILSVVVVTWNRSVWTLPLMTVRWLLN